MRDTTSPAGTVKDSIPRDHFPRSILVSTATSRACLAYLATSPSSLPRVYLIGRPAVCCDVVLPVGPYFGVVLQSPRARHARLVAHILARTLRDATRMIRRKLLPWNLSLTADCVVLSQHSLCGKLTRLINVDFVQYGDSEAVRSRVSDVLQPSVIRLT